MKKILSLLIISILIIIMSIPAFAGNLSTYPDIYSSDERIENAPLITDIENYILFWDNAYNCYIRFPFSEGESFSSDGKTLNRYNSSGNSISVVNNLYQNNTWGGNRYDASYSASWLELISYSEKAVLSINGESITSPEVVVESVVFTDPSKTLYNVGDTFDSSGITVTANYSDGTSKDVTSESIITPPDLSSSGMNIEGTVEYGIWTYTFTVNVEAVEVVIPDEGNETEKSILEQIIGFFSDFWYYLKDTFRWIFIPDMDVLFSELKLEVDETVGKVPLIGQVVTIWKNVFNVQDVQVFSIDNELKVDTGINFSSQFYDEYTQQRINSAYLSTLDLSEFEESDIPVSYVFSDPSQDITLHVPVPFHDGQYRDMVIPTSLYSAKLVNLDFLGIRIQSAQDLMFLFCEMIMWWNFILLLTKWALNFFSTNPFAEFIQESNDKHELVMKEIEMEKENEEIEKEKQAMAYEKFPNPDAYRKKRDFELREARQEKKYLDYRMSQKKK